MTNQAPTKRMHRPSVAVYKPTTQQPTTAVPDLPQLDEVSWRLSLRLIVCVVDGRSPARVLCVGKPGGRDLRLARARPTRSSSNICQTNASGATDGATTSPYSRLRTPQQTRLFLHLTRPHHSRVPIHLGIAQVM
jgi:hypothetical protein